MGYLSLSDQVNQGLKFKGVLPRGTGDRMPRIGKPRWCGSIAHYLILGRSGGSVTRNFKSRVPEYNLSYYLRTAR